MPVSSSPSTPPSLNTLVLLAYKRAGLLPVEATVAGANMTAKLSHGRQLLDLLIDGLAVEGFTARAQSFYSLAVVAGTSSYTLTDTVLDVFEDGMFYETGQTTELPVRQIDLATWPALTDKSTESSRPQLYAAFRDGATPVVKLWPVPTEGGTLRLKAVRLFGSNATGTDSPDLQRYWLDALVWMLAHYLAVDASMPAERCSLLQATAEQKKRACIRYGFEHTSQQVSIAYTTPWSN
jgi:hypothetical protein